MSAFVVTPEHIATCAAIMRKPVFGYWNPPTDAAVRTELAIANVASVAWRYGPDGQEAYAPMLAAIVGTLTPEVEVIPPKATDDVDKACFHEGYTWMQFVEDCQAAEPIKYTPAEAGSI